MSSETSVAELLALEAELVAALETAEGIEDRAVGESALKDLRRKIALVRQAEGRAARAQAFFAREREEATELRKSQAFRIADAVAVCAKRLREEGELTGLLRVLVDENECTIVDCLVKVASGHVCPEG